MRVLSVYMFVYASYRSYELFTDVSNLCCIRCVVCQMKYKRGDRQTTLPCKHAYHSACVTKWLRINKVSRQARKLLFNECYTFSPPLLSLNNFPCDRHAQFAWSKYLLRKNRRTKDLYLAEHMEVVSDSIAEAAPF